MKQLNLYLIPWLFIFLIQSPYTFNEHLYITTPETEFLTFEANFNGDVVSLYWTMNPGPNLSFITVEKSKNQRDFIEVLSIDASGSFNGAISYCEIDNKPWKRITYYRLKATDNFGDCFYSVVATVKVNKKRLKLKKSTKPQYSPDKGGKNSSWADLDLKHEILIIVRDKYGNEHYTKVIITGYDGTYFIVVDQEKKLAPGIYLVTGSEDYRLDQCKIKVEPTTATNQ